MWKLQLHPEPSRRSQGGENDRKDRRRRTRGFQLIELLVVIFLIAMAAFITGFEGLKAIKRQKLASTAQDIQQYLRQASILAQKNNARVTVTIGPRVSPVPDSSYPEYSPTPIQMTGVGSDGIPVAGLPSYTVPKEVCLSSVAPDKVQSLLWDSGGTPDDPSSSVTRALTCDFFLRTIFPTTGRQIAPAASPAQPGAVIALSHADMVLDRLKPKLRYLIVLSPVWEVRLIRQLWNGSTWVAAEGV